MAVYKIREKKPLKPKKRKKKVERNPSICKAIRDLRLLSFNYHGKHRVVEPYVHGKSFLDNPALRCYQIEGSSVGWKFMLTDSMIDIVMLEEDFKPGHGYKSGDKHMKSIYCEV
jgi:hypothetical protein